MNKIAAMVAGGLLLYGAVGVATAGSRCEAFTGTLKLTLNPQPTLGDCRAFDAIKKKERIFEDAVFIYEQFAQQGYPVAQGLPGQICFSGVISGATLGGHLVEASSLSALTVNNFPSQCGSLPCPPMFTAATVVTVTADREPRKDKDLGQIFLRDTGVLLPPENALGPFSVEQLIGVGGTKKFAKASVSMEIAGYEFAGTPVPNVRGTICR